LVIFLAFILDRSLKALVVGREGFFVIKNFLKINYYPNRGIAFSLPLNHFIIYFLLIIIMPIIFYYLFWAFKKNNFSLLWGTSLIFTGAFSNLLDRFYYKEVIDYINFVGRFPVFNLADVMIVIGSLVLIGWGIFFKNKKNRA